MKDVGVVAIPLNASPAVQRGLSDSLWPSNNQQAAPLVIHLHKQNSLIFNVTDFNVTDLMSLIFGIL